MFGAKMGDAAGFTSYYYVYKSEVEQQYTMVEDIGSCITLIKVTRFSKRCEVVVEQLEEEEGEYKAEEK